LLASTSPLTASLIIASFGDSTPYNKKSFDLIVKHDPNVQSKAPEKPLRYGKLEEIHHIFKADPKSPPKIITLFFTVAVLAALPALFGGVCTTTIKIAIANHLVVVPWWKRQPHFKGPKQRTSLSCIIFRINCYYGIDFYDVLSIVEFISNSTSCCSCWSGCFRQWK
jgi:hypothetical protein